MPVRIPRRPGSPRFRVAGMTPEAMPATAPDRSSSICSDWFDMQNLRLFVPPRATSMIRTFSHFFDPASANPISGTEAELTIQEIEDAGIREVLQTPGAPLGSWNVLDALLEPTGAGSPFVFREPLGQAREVKVALSGLFGRFVARAYLALFWLVRLRTSRPPRHCARWKTPRTSAS
jgi:hypothetical protein